MPTTVTPAWKGASTGSQPLAGQVNQYLGTHAATFIYTGASFAAQATAGSGSTNSNSLWLAESFTTGSTTAIGRARIFLGYTGSPNPLTLFVYASSAGAPTGSALVGTTVPKEYLTAGGASVSIPIPTALTASTTYWLVIAAVGDVSNFYSWSKNNQASGASTSPNGTTWTAQTYGFIYTCFDQSVTSSLAHTWEDAGARWTNYVTNAAALPTTLQEYTVAQAANDYVYSSRTFTYSGSNLTSLS